MWKPGVFFFVAAVILGSWLPMAKMEVPTVYMKGLLCNSSEKFVYQNMSSRAKSYNRTFSSFTILATAKKPIHDLFVRRSYGFLGKLFILILKLAITVFFKYTAVYRDVIHTPNFDFCQVMKMGTTNLLIKQLLDVINSTELLHECPYQVTDMFIIFLEISTVLQNQFLRLRDFVPNNGSLLSLLPSGEYKLNFRLTTRKEFFCDCNIFATLTTAAKNNFW